METLETLETPVEVKMCSACGQNPRAAQDSTNPHCKDCRAIYMRIYRQNGGDRSFAKGVAAARKYFAQKFSALGPNTFNGVQAAQWVLTDPGPAVPD